MKKTLLAGVALIALFGASAGAADLARPVYKAAPPPVPVWSWSGFYIGGHVGAAWGTTEAEFTDSTILGILGGGSFPISQDSTNGFLGGVTAGLNWQVAPWAVVGVEGDFSWTDLKGTSPCVVGLLSCSTKHDWISTVAGRFGVTYDRALLYVKGGVAWSKAKYSASSNLGIIGGTGFTTEVSDTRFGALFGAGVEYAFTPNWSAKIEYNYIDFGHKDYAFPLFDGVSADVTVREKIHTIKAGLNYKFDWGGPVVAKY